MIVQMHSAGSLKLALCRIKVACCMAMALSCVCAHIASGVQLMHVLSAHGSVNYDSILSIVASDMIIIMSIVQLEILDDDQMLLAAIVVVVNS